MTKAKVMTTHILAALVLSAFAAFGCNGPSVIGGPEDPSKLLPDISHSDPKNPEIPSSRTYVTDVLLFNGTGVSVSDWQTTELILRNEGLTYDLANTAQLNEMSLEELAGYGTIIIPGGSGGTIYKNLTPSTRLRVRQAVRERGVGYVGFCAGAWVAVGPEADTSDIASYGIVVAEGATLPYWYPPSGGSSSAIVPVTFANGSRRELIWVGGPATPEWKSGVVARYADGEPAISQTWSGQGYVVISGPHPEAPQGWRTSAVGYDDDGLDYDIALDMIYSALNKKPLPAF